MEICFIKSKYNYVRQSWHVRGKIINTIREESVFIVKYVECNLFYFGERPSITYPNVATYCKSLLFQCLLLTQPSYTLYVSVKGNFFKRPPVLTMDV